jgi:hypothetical protein
MAGAAEGVWLDSESIHPIAFYYTIGGTRFNWRGVTRDLGPSSRKPSSSRNLDIRLPQIAKNPVS